MTNLHDAQQKFSKAILGKRHLIWDWNGTLLNDVDHAVETMNHLLGFHQLPRLYVERYKQVFEFPILNYYTALGFDFMEETFESLCHKFVDRFMQGFRACPLIPGMREILHQCREAGLRQSVLSATDQKSLDKMIDHFEIRHVFAFVFGIDNKLAGSKVQRGHELMENSRFAPQATVLIGDTLHDLEVGNELGIEVILLAHGHQCAKRLRRHHSHVLELESEISAPITEIAQ